MIKSELINRLAERNQHLTQRDIERIVGTIFDTVIKEGVHLARGNEGNWGAQAVDLSPAQGAIVELTTAEDGLYPIVTHAFNFVGRGALGILQAGDGDPTN